jgi:hypothetical protein
MAIPLTLRLVKGSKLTFAELDQNFISLRNAINTATGSDTFVTGGTYNPATVELNFTGNGGFNPFNVDVSNLLDTYVSGGVYDPTTGCATFTTTSGYTFDVCGFLTGATEPAEVVWTGGSAGNYSVKQITDTTTDATGNYSVAQGFNTLASGQYSHTEGYSNIASGEASHAEGGFPGKGYFNIASGLGSHAEGSNTVASGASAHAEGFFSVAGGSQSHAEGRGLAFGDSSHAEGYQAIASGEQSHAEGYQTTASGEASHAEGYQSTASGDYSHAEGGFSGKGGGGNTAFGLASHAEGANTIASGRTSHTEGFSTLALSPNAHAEGATTTASGYASHSEGINTLASGNYSHSEGQQTTASGYASHAEGLNNVASGNYSHAEGRETTSSGEASHAGGFTSTASGQQSFIHSTNSLVTGNRSVVLGGQNLTGTTDDTVFVPFLNINNINTGTSINNLGVDSSGNVVVGTTGSSGDYLPLTGGTMVNGAEINLYNDSGDIAKIFGTNAHSGVSDIEITSDNGLLKVSTDSGIIVDNGIVSHNNSSLVSIQPNGTGFIGNLIVPTITAARTWSLPDENGTIALTTDLNGYISLSGNTSGTCINELWVSNISGCSPVNFGTEVVFNQNASMGSSAGDTGVALKFFHQDPGDESTIQTDADNLIIGGKAIKILSEDDVSLTISDVLQVAGGPTGMEFSPGVGQVFNFSAPTLTGSRSANFPDKSGTVAYTSDLSSVTGFTYSNNNFTISQSGGLSDLVSNISVMTGLTVNGQTTMSGNGQSVLTVIGSGSGSTTPLFTVQGDSGELFSITDSLVGELFTVNDISGLPILKVSDDDTVLMGNYQVL